MPARKPCWDVSVEKAKCTLCEVCAARCPTAAITLSREGDAQTLLFQVSLCNGCDGAFVCRELCPEKAIRIGRSGSAKAPEKAVILARGKFVECPDCHALFAPRRKVAALRRKTGAARRRDHARRCPACRRKRLLRNLPR